MKYLDIRGKVTILDDDDYEVFKNQSLFSSRGDYVISTKLRIPIHRIITKCPEGLFVDHINNNPLDNRKENLRICTVSQNHMNKHKYGNKYTSRFKGVHWDKQKNKWRSIIYKDKKRKHLGYFSNEESAAKAYNSAALDLYGEFAKLNEI